MFRCDSNLPPQNIIIMQILNIVHFVYLVLYFLLAGQASFYKLCFTQVFAVIPASQFLAIRKLADPILQRRLSILYYSSLIFGITFTIYATSLGSLSLKLAAISSLLLLLTDIILAKKYNIPLNTAIRNAVAPGDDLAMEWQRHWLRWINVRGNFIIAGFIVLLVSKFV